LKAQLVVLFFPWESVFLLPILHKCFLLPSFHLTIPKRYLDGVIIGILAQIGDLAESLLKRDAFVKDSNSLPGLGGVLDMLDSLLFTSPVVIFHTFLKWFGSCLLSQLMVQQGRGSRQLPRLWLGVWVFLISTRVRCIELWLTLFYKKKSVSLKKKKIADLLKTFRFQIRTDGDQKKYFATGKM